MSNGRGTSPVASRVVATTENTPGTVRFEAAAAPRVGREVTRVLTDPDRPRSITWAWHRVPSMASPTPLMAEPNRAATYLPVAADVGHRLRATATYTDDHGPGQTAAGTTSAEVAPGTITFSADPPTPCAHVEATLTDADGGINTESADSPPNFSYGWQWDPPPASSSSRSPVTTSTTQTNSVVGQTIGVRVQYGDNASDRNTVDTTSAVVQANVPRTPLALRSTPGDRRVSLVWGAPDDCAACHY